MASIEGNFRKMSTELPAPPQATQTQQPAPKKKKGLPKWLTGIIAAVVVAGGVLAYNYFTNDVAQAKAGDCAKVTGTESKPEYAAVACDSADANVTVAKALASTSDSCNGDYLEFTTTSRRGPDAKLCLMPKWKEGECYNLDQKDAAMPAKATCGAPETLKVAKVVTGKADDAACGEGSMALKFAEPATTYCLAPSAT
jgi:hypothetical protein